jgi:hypothetical protein
VRRDIVKLVSSATEAVVRQWSADRCGHPPDRPEGHAYIFKDVRTLISTTTGSLVG